MYCKNCGNNIESNQIFCTKCGNKVNSDLSKNKTPFSKAKEWWQRLLDVVYILAYIPLILIIIVVWNSNAQSCYYNSCSGSLSESFGYSILALIIYMVILRLIKLAVVYVVSGQKPEWDNEFKKFF